MYFFIRNVFEVVEVLQYRTTKTNKNVKTVELLLDYAYKPKLVSFVLRKEQRAIK